MAYLDCLFLYAVHMVLSMQGSDKKIDREYVLLVLYCEVGV